MDDVLMQAPLFSALDPEAAAALRAATNLIRIPKGGVLFREGDPGDRLYVLEKGKIKLGTASTDGRDALLAIVGPGEMIGELSLFDPGPRAASATALTDVAARELGHDALGRRLWCSRDAPYCERVGLTRLGRYPNDRLCAL